MKLITFAVPSYNSEEYLHRCVDSLLIGGEDVEILIINDGSTDRTKEIADTYEKMYPSIVRAIHKENGGHGSGVNRGVQEATGLFYKVVDSDDWLNEEALKKLLQTIKQHQMSQQVVDMYVCNFVYDKVVTNEKYIRSYAKNFPTEQICTWNEVKPFRRSSTLLMHALIFKTSILRESNTWLPEHTFYVDNLFAYKPLPYIEKIYYMDIALYHYFIGRSDQSITLANIINRYEQQIRVMNHLIDSYSYADIKRMNKNLRKYMKHYLSAIMTITLMFTIGKDSPERRKNLKQLWRNLKEKDLALYRFLRYRSIPTLVNFLPWKLRGFVLVTGYKVLRKRIKLG